MIGINLLVWNGQVGAAEIALFPKLRALGYDGVELPIFGPEMLDLGVARAALAENGLACTVSTAMPAGVNLIDAERRADGVAFLQTIIEQAAAVGASIVCGPLAAPVGELRGRGCTVDEWRSCVVGLREAGLIAADHGVTLALEPLNRFETFVVNTVADGVRLMDEVDQPAVGLLLDTFHMHIEEKSTAAAIRLAGRHLKHFHASENDRGIIGSGQVAWPSVFGALRDIDYTGWTVVESFSHAIPELAGATCIWRPLAPSPEVLAHTQSPIPTQTAMTYLSIVIPAYNEAEAIQAGKLERVTRWMATQPFVIELLVVDDGSNDNTAKFAESIATRVLTIPHKGKAAAIMAGIDAARGEIVLFTDMDQATPITHAPALLDAIEKRADIVIGSRGLVRPGAPAGRYVLSWGQVALRTLLTGLYLMDTQCGFKAMKRAVALETLAHLHRYHPGQLDLLQQPSVTSGFDVELLFVARRLGYQIGEVPITWNYQETRRVNLVRDAWRGIDDLVKILIADWQGKYPQRARATKSSA